MSAQLRDALSRSLPSGVLALQNSGELSVKWLHALDPEPQSAAKSENAVLLGYTIVFAGATFAFLPILHPANMSPDAKVDTTPMIFIGIAIALAGLVLVWIGERSRRRQQS